MRIKPHTKRKYFYSYREITNWSKSSTSGKTIDDMNLHKTQFMFGEQT